MTIPLPEPTLYVHELLSNGGGIWLGCPEKDVVEKASDPGETGDVVLHMVTLEAARAYGDARAAEERDRCAAILLANAEACTGLTREILLANVVAIRKVE